MPVENGYPNSDASYDSGGIQETATKSHSINSESLRSLSVVPGTPNADTPESFPSSDPPQACVQPFPNARQVHRAGAALVGTPSAVGAIRVRKSSTMSQFMTPAPIRGSPLAMQDSVVSRCVSKKSTNEQEESADAEQMEFEAEDARLVLEVARLRRSVCQLEQDLAETKGEENLALCNLYKHRAKEAGRLLAYAEFDVGFIRNSMRNAGVSYQVLDGPRISKRRRMSPSTQATSSPIARPVYSGSPEV